MNLTELEQAANDAKKRLDEARKAANAHANARKRAAKQLGRWQAKNVGVLSPSESSVVDDLCNGLDPQVKA